MSIEAVSVDLRETLEDYRLKQILEADALQIADPSDFFTVIQGHFDAEGVAGAKARPTACLLP